MTQRQLRTLRQQMNFDPTRLSNVANATRVVGEQMALTAQKAVRLKAQFAQFGDEKLERIGVSVKELSTHTRNASVRAAELHTHYDSINSSLENLKQKINNVVSASEGKRIDLFDNKSRAETEALVEKYRQLGVVAKEDAELLFRLKDAHNAVQAEMGDMDKVAKYQRLKTDIDIVTNSLREQAVEWVKLREKAWAFSDGTKPKMDRLKVVGDELEAQFRELQNAFNLNPTDVRTATLLLQNAADRAKVLREQLSLAQQKLNAMNDKGVRRTSESFSALSARLKENITRLTELKERLDVLEGEIRQSKLAITTLKKGTVEFDKMAEHIKECEREARTLEARLKSVDDKCRTDHAQKELRELEMEISSTNSKLIQTGNLMRMDKGVFAGLASNFKSLGMTLFSTLTPAAMMIGTYAITAADEVDAAYRNMRKTVQGTDEQFEQLKQDAIEFSETHFTSADQLLEIEAIGGQLGIAAENLGTFAEVVSSLDIATNLDTEQAATQLGQLNGIMADLTEDKFSNFADALVRLGNNSPTLESNIMDVTLRLASMSQTIGMSTPDVLAWSTAIAATGQKSEAAGTAIAKTFSNIETAVAGGGDILTAFADVAKMSAEDFAATWESNPTEALKAFIKGLRDIQDAGGSVDGTLEDLKITGVRQKQAIEGLVQTIDMMDSSLEMSNDAWDGVSDQWGRAGDAAREADRKSEGFSGTMQKLRNNAQELAMNMGESLTPILNVALSLLKGLNDVFMSLPSGTRTAITAILAAAAGFGPMLTMVSTTMTMFGNLTSNARTARITLKAINKVASKAGGIEKLGIVVAKTGEAFDAATMSMDGNIIKSRESGAVIGKAAISNGKYARSVRVMSAAMKAFSTAGIIAGIAAATIVITLIVKKIADATEKARTFKQIQDNLRTSNLNTADSIGKNTTELEKLNATFEATKSVTKEASDGLQSLSDTASNINRTFTENQADVSELEHYGKIIDELLPNTQRTAEEQAKLEDAVAHVNSITGESLQTSSDYADYLYNEGDGAWYVADAMAGEYDSIMDLIDAKQREMEAEAFRQAQSEVFQEEIDARQDVAAAMQQQEDLQNQINEATAKFQAGEMTQDEYLAKVDSLNDQLGDVNSSLEENKRRLDLAAEASSSYADASVLLEMASGDAADAIAVKLTDSLWDIQPILAANNESMLDLRNQLAGAGIDTEAFAGLTTEQLQEIALKYDGTFGSIDELLDEYGVSYDGAAAQTIDASATMRNELERVGAGAISAFEEANGPIEDFITALQDAGIGTQQLASLTPEQLQLVLDSYDGTIESVTGLLDEFKTTAKTKGTEGGKKYAAGINSAEPDVSSAAGNLVYSAESGLKNGDSWTPGLNFGLGYARGMISQDVTNAVWKAGEHLATLAKQALDTTQETGSPAKVAIESGRYFGQGYALGIELEGKNVAKSAAAMSQTAIDNVAGVMDYMDSPEFSQAVSFRTVSADDVYNSTLRAINDSGGMGIYLDGDVLVGRTAKRMDAALGSRRSLAGRGIG